MRARERSAYSSTLVSKILTPRIYVLLMQTSVTLIVSPALWLRGGVDHALEPRGYHQPAYFHVKGLMTHY